MPLSVTDLNGIYIAARPQLHHYLMRRVQCQDTAADLLQEVYLRLPHLKPPPETEAEVRAWLYRVASNLSIDHARTQRRQSELLEQYYGDESEMDESATQDLVALLCEEIERVHVLLAQLGQRCTEILKLNRIEGLTYAEVAEQLGISKSLVEKEMVRILNHLRTALDDEDQSL